MPETKKTISISLERYYELLEAEANMLYLEANGVDNWDGYAQMPLIKNFPSLEAWQEKVGQKRP